MTSWAWSWKIHLHLSFSLFPRIHGLGAPSYHLRVWLPWGWHIRKITWRDYRQRDAQGDPTIPVPNWQSLQFSQSDIQAQMPSGAPSHNLTTRHETPKPTPPDSATPEFLTIDNSIWDLTTTKNCHFKPLEFGVIGYAEINTWHSSVSCWLIEHAKRMGAPTTCRKKSCD